jgi:phosphotransferase system enzyme I (PtsP)
VEEFDQAKAIVERELTHLRKHGHGLPERVFVGAMVEVPSLLFQLDEILARADFLSVGSNDLVQFLYAADRSNVRVADRFDPLSPAALRAFRMVAEAGIRHGKPVTLCGELASRPLEAVALAALGYRALSVSPAALGPVKATMLELDVAAARKVLMPMLEDRSGALDIRGTLRAFALASGLAL